MRQLVIGTTNRGKVRQVVGALSSLADLECVPIDLVRHDLPVVSEVGASAEDVAAVKAVVYSTAIDEPVLSLDHWLRFPEASVDDQPLARVRRIPGHDDSGAHDEQIIATERRPDPPANGISRWPPAAARPLGRQGYHTMSYLM